MRAPYAAPLDAPARPIATVNLAWLLFYVDRRRAYVAALAAIELAQASGDLPSRRSAGRRWRRQARPLRRPMTPMSEPSRSPHGRGPRCAPCLHCTASFDGRCTASPTRPCSRRPAAIARFPASRDERSACATPSPLVSQAKLGQVLIQAGRVDEGEHELAGCEQLLTLETTMGGQARRARPGHAGLPSRRLCPCGGALPQGLRDRG